MEYIFLVLTQFKNVRFKLFDFLDITYMVDIIQAML